MKRTPPASFRCRLPFPGEGADIPSRLRTGDEPVCAQAALALELLRSAGRPVCWIAADAREMERLAESFRTILAEEEPVPAPDIFLFRAEDRDPAVLAEHLRLACRLAETKTEPFLVISCPAALDISLARPRRPEEALCVLRPGDRRDPEELARRLAEAGYTFGVEVYRPGEAARRGGILDVWPPGAAHPFRIEFFGDEVESIRRFDDQTQCSVGPAEEAVLPLLLHPPREAEHARRLFDLLPPDAVVINPPDGSGEPVGSGFRPFPIHLPPASLSRTPAEAEADRRRFVEELCRKALDGWQILLFFETQGTLTRFRELYESLDGFDRLHLRRGVLHESAEDPDRRILLVTEEDFYGYLHLRDPAARRARRFRPRERVSEAADIQPGDYVVHVEHGIGKYLGLIETRFGDRRMEVLCIEYARGERVHLPVSQAHLLTRYKGGGKHLPRLHALAGKRWKKERESAESAVRDLAARLLETHARRLAHRGYAFSPDTPLQAEFEAAFPYPETPDQLKAIEEIKRDMERPRPMDRLLCGDVGFGKTEVAMRAAFKAVMDAKQVAVLVPTTVLAQQHYETFTERMAAFPVRIEMVSRFRTPARQREILAAAARGEIDILIGTHRLLSPDVSFRDLGLVIIDEEQRFGVEAKEHLKALRSRVDVLTLSATPIPRTLYMSITGVRDLSLLRTAPQRRQPVETIVAPPADDLIAEAVRHELRRGGQVFYLHNRIKTIGVVEERLRRLVPEARIAIAHGRMGERALSEIMHAFTLGRFDLLLCTTIIENGVDIPNCNTLIVENADRFGLSDLYQLRGRVGRSPRKAFAYFLLSPERVGTETLPERLRALQRYSSLGSGFRLALRDLELRGAGNLLGARQSGHIAAVGFDLYCRLLRRSIAILQGRKPPPLIDVSVKLDFLDFSPRGGDPRHGAFLPYDYVEDENLRLRLYQRLAALDGPREISLFRQELRDRFGPLPPPVRHLLLIAELRAAAAARGVTSVVVRDGRIRFTRGRDALLSGPPPLLPPGTPAARLRKLISILRKQLPKI